MRLQYSGGGALFYADVKDAKGARPVVEIVARTMLEAEVRALSERLERGWQVIEAARAAGEAGNDTGEVARLERHFLRLLDEYERRCDALWEVE